MSAHQHAATGVWVSVVAYVVLTVLKLSVGHFANALSLQADGYNNVTDVVASVTLLAGLWIARKPRDENHPYGHSRAETIASLITALIMMAIGFQVLYGAVLRVTGQTAVHAPDPLAAWVGGLSAIVMLGVYGFNRGQAARLNSVGLRAMSKDNLTDALVSVGAVVGVLGARYEQPWLDPAVALIIGVMICRTSWSIFSESATILTDGFDEQKLHRYRATVLSVPGVRGIGDLKARSLGSHVVVDVTIEVSPALNVVDSHNIADAIEYEMKRRHQVHSTLIHVEPSTRM